MLVAVKAAIEDNGGCGMSANLWTDGYKKQTYLSCTERQLQGEVIHSSAAFRKLFQPANKTGESNRNELILNLSEFGLNAELL